MVALNTAYAAPKNAADPKNRVGDFFMKTTQASGKSLGKPLKRSGKIQLSLRNRVGSL